MTALTELVSAWPDVALTPDRARAVAFQVRGKTFGRLRPSGLLDVAFPETIRTALIARGTVGDQSDVPSTEWIRYRLRDGEIDRPVFLLRLAYLYRTLVGSRDALGLDRIADELDDLHVEGPLRDAYDDLLARRRPSVDVMELPRGYTLPAAS